MEVVLLVLVSELSVVQAHSSKNLLRMALASGGDLRLAAQPGPGGVQGWRLAEGSLVFKNDHRPFHPGFFLRRGYV